MENSTVQLPDYISITSEFVPFSVSRDAGKEHKTLNWNITVTVDGKQALATAYSAGCAHCPSYKQMASRSERYSQRLLIEAETETGYKHKWSDVGDRAMKTKEPINPDAVSVVYSLISDASVLDYGGFEDWASDFGYDPDSRSAEKLYHECLKLALQLRHALGDKRLSELQELLQDY